MLTQTYRPRERVLSDPELVEVWRAAETLAGPFAALVKLLMLTGLRLREVACAKWAEIDLAADIWTVPAERSKNRKPHILHLSPQAKKVIEGLPILMITGNDGKQRPSPFLLTTTGETPISGFSKGKNHLDKAIAKARKKAAGEEDAPEMPHWTLHDFRRSIASGLPPLGVAPHIADRLLNHVPASLKGVAAIYQRYEFLAERKAAAETWGAHIEEITSTKESAHTNEAA